MSQGPTLSVTIIGHNEADHLRRLSTMLGWADEVVYVDCESADDSLTVATEAGWKVSSRPNLTNLNVNKEYAIEQSSSEWVFYLDPDEEIPEPLCQEIRTRIGSEQYVAYKLSRRNHFFGRWVRYGSQYPDVQLRLFRRDKASFPKKHVHEKLAVDGKTGKLANDMLHFPYLSISQYLKKFDFYTSFEATHLYEAGVRPGGGNLLKFCVAKPLSRFFRRYFLKSGFRDGWQGLFAAAFDGVHYFVRYMKLCEIVSNKGRQDG